MSDSKPIKFCDSNNGLNNCIKKSYSTTNLNDNLIKYVNKKDKLKIKKCYSETELDFRNYIKNLMIRLNNTNYQRSIIFKHVTFKDNVKVFLIPTKEEFKKAGLKEILWCTKDEYKKFKSEYEYRVRNCFEETENNRYKNTRSPVFQISANKESQF